MNDSVLKETGRIVDIQDDSLWVETIQRSTCGSCVAEKGCGQTLLRKLGVEPSYLRVPLPKNIQRNYSVNDSVVIGIPDDIVVKASLLLYLLPLVLLLVFSGIAHTYYVGDAVSILAGVAGFAIGCLLLRWHSHYYRNDKRHQAFLVEDELIQEIKFN